MVGSRLSRDRKRGLLNSWCEKGEHAKNELTLRDSRTREGSDEAGRKRERERERERGGSQVLQADGWRKMRWPAGRVEEMSAISTGGRVGR